MDQFFRRRPTSPDDYCDECWRESPEAVAARKAKEHERIEESRREALCEVCSIVPLEIQETDIAHREFNRHAWHRIEEGWDPESDDWLWLHSRDSGRCKSRCAYLALVEKCAAFIRERSGSFHRVPKILWADGSDLIGACRMRNQYSAGESAMHRARAFVESAATAHLLIIDDLSKQRMTGESVSDGLWKILKHRHEWRLWTCITDNTSPDDLEGLLHPKHAPFIIRRLAERCIEIDFDAEAMPSECG